MTEPRLAARRLAPALAVAWAALNLSACHDPSGTERVAALAAQIDPPQLWRAEALGPDGRVEAAAVVCVDTPLREGLARAIAEVNGQHCQPFGQVTAQHGLYALRCQVDGRVFGMTVNSRGDLARDFTVRFALQALDGSNLGARQTRRYRYQGPCPAGWIVGYQAKAPV